MAYTFADAEIGLTESANGGSLLVQRVGDRKEQRGTQSAGIFKGKYLWGENQ